MKGRESFLGVFQRATLCYRSAPTRCRNFHRIRRFSSSPQCQADVVEETPIQAAPAMDLTATTERKMSKLRVVPVSPSYFSGKPTFTDDLLRVQALLRKYQTLPLSKPENVPKVAWHTYTTYRDSVGGEPVRSSRYSRMVEILKRLNFIDQSIMPEEVKEEMKRYKKDAPAQQDIAKPILIDEYGRARGVGRRKSSSAEVWLVEGEGEVLINGRSLSQAFPRMHDRESVIWALKATERLDRYNVWALVKGGGTTGQAEALTLGITNALMAHEPLLKPSLRRAGVVARDPRRVERKKPGKVKARKMPAWVKR